MDTVEEKLNIQEYADAFDVNTPMPSTEMSESGTSVTGIFDFAPAEDILVMQDFFGFDSIQMLGNENIDTMKTISAIAQQEGVPLYDVLLELSGRVGGRMTEGFVGRVNVYLGMLAEEKRLNTQLDLVKMEKNNLALSYENSNII